MSSLIRLYPACFTGDIHTSYKCWVSRYAHTISVQKVDRVPAKRLRTNMPPYANIYELCPPTCTNGVLSSSCGWYVFLQESGKFHLNQITE